MSSLESLVCMLFFHSPWRMSRIFHLEEYATKYLRRSLVSKEELTPECTETSK